MSYHPRTRHLLAQLGLAPVELDALDHPRRHQMPQGSGGFGLMGDAGTGKTWALVRMVADQVDGFVRRQQDPRQATLLWVDGDRVVDGRLRWVLWPRMAREFQDRRLDHRWRTDWAEVLEETRLLVLDDLGRETRLRGEDPAWEVLQRVVEFRQRRKLPVLWTSNLKREEFVAFYGAPLSSRILGAWPDYQVEGQDMRLFPDLKTAAGGEG